MRKIGSILLFIFLTGLFTGLFFSTCLSTKNTETLSALLLTGITTSKTGFLQSFLTSLLTNFMLFFLMLPALLSRCLCPLPPLVLWYKSFAIGFCSGLVLDGSTLSRPPVLSSSYPAAEPLPDPRLFPVRPGSPILLSAKLPPPIRCRNMPLQETPCSLLIPAAAHSAPAGSSHAKSSLLTKDRLLPLLIISSLLLAAGSLTEAALRLAALSPS